MTVTDLSLVGAVQELIQEYAARHGLIVAFSQDIDALEPASTLRRTVFRIIEECLTNVRRHASTNIARVEIACDAEILRLEVEDWGIGFDPHGSDHRGLGLQEICTRAALLGGRAAVESSTGSGTLVVVELPISIAHTGKVDFASETPLGGA